MKTKRDSVIKAYKGMKAKSYIFLSLIMAIFLSLTSMVSFADDTDIYRPKVRHNVTILVDNSDSMGYPIYDDAIDYHEFYQYICEICSGGSCDWQNARDAIAGSATDSSATYGYKTDAYFYDDSKVYAKTKIYLVYGNVGFANDITGDAADPDYVWWVSAMRDTKTWITASGELVDQNGKHPGDAGYEGRVGTEVDSITGEVMITLDGIRLPNNQDKKLHDWQENPDGSRVDNGFAGLIRAPGYTFSGYFYKGSGDSSKDVDDADSSFTSDPASAGTYDGKEKDYFFITGNWMNMQMVYNLEVEVSNNKWERAWEYCTYPAQYYAPVVDFYMVPPTDASGNYFPAYDSLQDTGTNNIVYNGEASKIKLHFGNLSLAAGDRIEFYNENSALDYSITSDSIPADGWTNWIDGRQVLVRFVTDSDPDTVAAAWKIDTYQYQSKVDYEFFTRLEATISAIIDVVEATRGKVTWGVQGFGEAHGTPAMNPSFNDDQQRQGVINNLLHFTASGPSNIAESLDLVLQEFNARENLIYRGCNHNFVITVSDGYADNDTFGTDWTSSVANYADLDAAEATEHQYTQDPIQYATPPPDYYDDIAGFMYSHSYRDLTTEIPEADRPGSAENITVHNIGCSSESAMLKHASELGGGVFLTAYSKSQLVNAFYALGILIAEYTSYTAPVVSVDETNRVQSGDRLYMALFKPNEELYWTGNLKKYGIKYGVKPSCGDGISEEWYVVDSTGKSATTCDGEMIPETLSHWSSELDGGDVEKGGAGQVLYNDIPFNFGIFDTSVNTIDFRHIYMYDSVSGGLVQVGINTLTNTALNVNQDMDRYRIVNYIYGYTYEAHTAATALEAGSPNVEGSPVSKRWPLGPIIHSTPKIIDYLDSAGGLTNRYIAVGANDGMLHVFNNTNGEELFAFLPEEVLPKMKEYDSSVSGFATKVYTVDGSPMLLEHKNSSGDMEKLLIFGLRRGGRSYYALDVTSETNILANWNLKWKVNNYSTDMGELGLSFAMPKHIKIDLGSNTYADYILLPGGYDPGEDKNDPTDNYTLDSTHNSAMGRAIYILNAETGNLEQKFDFNNKTQMKYCFPADPTVITGPKGVFIAAYITDLYGQVWKLTYNKTNSNFDLNLIFKMNPMTDQLPVYALRNSFVNWSGGYPGSIAFTPSLGTDIKNPRKTFYSPDVSYAGNCFTDFPVLYMGTGDREHPTFIGTTQAGYEPVKNGLYAFYDAHAYHMKEQGSYDENSEYFTEMDLLNVTCGALEPDLEVNSDAAKNWEIKTNIKTYLREDTKGWYLLFSELDNCAAVDNDVDFVNQDDHDGEKCIAPVTLFAKVVYAPTYQPNATASDPCTYDGAARLFAVDYCTGNAVYNFYEDNDTDVDNDGIIEEDDGDKTNYTRLDRYLDIGDHLPSGVSIVIRHGKAAGFISVGGKIFPIPEIDMPGSMIPFYWQEYDNN